MANRFEKLFCLPNNLYSDESPVIVVAGVLLKDTQSGKLVVQLKFKNISEFQIKALKIKLTAYDADGERIAGEREYQYLDLQISSGGEFGANKAIIMPDAATRSFDIQTIWAVEQNGTIHDVPMPLNALPLLRPLNTVINHEELVKQFILETNQQAAYAPRKVSDIWQCSCGEWNGSDVCTKCRIFKKSVFSVYDPTTLVEKTKNRLRIENAKKQAQAEQERLAVEKEATIQENSGLSTGNAKCSGKIGKKLKKKTTKGIIVLILVITICLTILLFSASAGSSEGMTALDRKYDKLANKAAMELLQSEVSDYTWTTVETGDLVYLYTAKNSKEDQFQVHYLAKFDAADEPEDEWVELTISISGKTGSVTDVSTCYWNVDTYESRFDENNHFRGFSWSSGAGGDWYNINLADDDFEAAKQKNSDYNYDVLQCVDYMIDMLGQPYKDEYGDFSESYLDVETFKFNIDHKQYSGQISYGNAWSPDIITSVYWRKYYAKYSDFTIIATALGSKLDQEAIEYTSFSWGYYYRDRKILVQKFDDFVQITIDNW